MYLQLNINLLLFLSLSFPLPSPTIMTKTYKLITLPLSLVNNEKHYSLQFINTIYLRKRYSEPITGSVAFDVVARLL